MAKYIFVTGGVVSSVGKGVSTASIGRILKSRSISISVQKLDPYLNVDPGTMSPYQHGEVFVTQDGAETDLDLGHYERLLGKELDKYSSVSSGQIFEEILEGERSGKFLGKCIQYVPHVVNAIKARLFNFSLMKNTDFVLIEIGGTVGDMEGIAFLEAVRQIKLELKDKMMLCHLSLVPTLSWSGEIKTKPTQHSVTALKKAGLIPDCLFLRTDKNINVKTLKKVSLMCGVEQDLVFQVLSRSPVYKVFLDLDEQGVTSALQKWFKFKKINKTKLVEWKKLINKIESAKIKLKIGLIAKYVGNNDPYISVIKAVKAAGFHNNCKVDIVIIDAQGLEKEGYNSNGKYWGKLKSVDGIVTPGGFDSRGVEGKIFAVKWARKNNIPYIGLCLGMQVMLIEFARSLLKLKDASSSEITQKSKNFIIALLQEQKKIKGKGGTMRLGAYPCTIKPKTLADKAYKKKIVFERHRHRYEFNNKYRKRMEDKGVVFSGIYKDKDLVEIAELKEHPFMVGTQFHPEFTSNPLNSHPLFKEFIKVAIKNKK